MIEAIYEGKTLTINGRSHSFEQRIDGMVVLEDRVLISLLITDFAVGDPLVGRNILAYDADGGLLWRIPATGATRRSNYGGMTPEAFFGLWRDGDVVKTGTPGGFDWEIDLDTGKIDNPVFTR